MTTTTIRARERVALAVAGLRPARRELLTRPTTLLAVLIAVGVSMRFYRFTAPILDQHAFRQTQTASTVWMWNRYGFDFFDYRVPMYGGGHWVLELPVYQALVWVLQVPLGGIESAGRIVSIASYVAVAVLTFALTRKLLGSTAAALGAVAVLTFLPVTVFYYRAFLLDPLVIATTLAALLLCIRLAERFTWRSWALFSVLLILSALGKGTIVFALGLPMLVLAGRILADRRVTLAHKLALVGTGVATGVLSVLWTRHGDALNVAGGGLAVSQGTDWFFGSTFTDAETFRIVGQRFLDNLGPIGLTLVAIGIAAVSSVRTRYRPELIALLAGIFLTVGIFANLSRIHDYYQLPFYVPLAMMVGLGISLIYQALRAPAPALARPLVVGLVIALATTWSLTTWNTYFAPGAVMTSFQGQGEEMRAVTPDSRLLVLQANADKNEPMLWYEARRTGWRVPTSDPAQARRLLDAHHDIGAIVLIRGPEGEPSYLSALATQAQFVKTYESPGLLVYAPPGSRPG